MQTTKQRQHKPTAVLTAMALGWVLLGSAVQAQTANAGVTPLTLAALFDQAWQRQPEARSTPLRREAAQATRRAAQAWTAEPMALELVTKTDRPGSNQGSREAEVGVALPLWLPGERAQKATLGDAEIQAVESRRRAAQLQLAATVRDTWWAAQRAQADLVLAQDRLLNTQRLAADVTRRVRAGDLSRADQAQADSAVAQAEAALAEAWGARDMAQAALAAWGWGMQDLVLADNIEPEPVVLNGVEALASHPAVADWQDQAEVARRAADLAAKQTRANPELTLAATRGRDQAGDRYQQTFTVGLRVPLGGDDRAHAKQAAARAHAIDAEARAAVERDRLAADIAAAVARVKASQAQRDALARHAALLGDTRGFIDKAFRLGEADWPTRLRVELEAVQAERQLARARIDAAAAVSTLRQAMGLLPQ